MHFQDPIAEVMKQKMAGMDDKVLVEVTNLHSTHSGYQGVVTLEEWQKTTFWVPVQFGKITHQIARTSLKELVW